MSQGVPEALEAISGSVFNVRDAAYGAIGDGVTDDTAAINLCLAAVRTEVAAGRTARFFMPSGDYYIAGSVNATNIRACAWVWDAPGATLLANCTGKPAVDLLDSRFIIMSEGFSIEGDSVNTPSYGIQFGIIAAGRVSGDSTFVKPVITGYYTKAPFYNFAAETVTVIHPRFSNNSVVADSYCLIMDGANHQNITSEFVTQTIAVGTNCSFNEQLFIQMDARKNLGGNCIKIMGQACRHYYENSYGVSVDGVVIEIFKPTGVMSQLKFDLHAETTAHTKYLTIDNVNPSSDFTIRGLTIRDHNPQSSVCMIDLTGTTRVVRLDDCDLDFGAPQSAVPVFGTTGGASKLLASGKINWSSPLNLDISGGYFNGEVHTENGTVIAHTLGSYEVMRRPTAAAQRVRQVKGILQVAGTGEGVDLSNYVEMQGAATGSGVTISAKGSDTDINLILAAQGIGVVQANSKITQYRNNANTSPQVSIEQASTGDPVLEFLLTGVKSWCMGVDNSDSDKFKISDQNDAFVSQVLEIDGSGNMVITGTFTSPTLIGGTTTTSPLTYKTTTGVGTTGADHIFQVGNNGATEAMRILNSGLVQVGTGYTPSAVLNCGKSNSSTAPTFTIEQASTGDASMQFVLSGVRAWLMGIDNSDSDKFKIASANNAFATGVVSEVSSTGDWVLPGSLIVSHEAIIAAGALTLGKTQHTLANATGSTYAVTLAAPTSAQMGMPPKTISGIDTTNTITLATTNILDTGGATITFDTAGDAIVLSPIQTGASTYAWLLTKAYGVTIT